MSVIKKVWKDPVGSAVIAGAILAVAGVGVATIQGWWPKIGVGVFDAAKWLVRSSSHPNWLLIVLWLSTLGAAFTLVAMAIERWRGVDEPPITWRSYCRDNFRGVAWQWTYTGGSHAKIERLTPLCPSCECILMRKDHDYYSGNFAYGLYCTHCEKSVADFNEDYYQLTQSVEILIDRNVRSGDWRRVVSAASSAG